MRVFLDTNIILDCIIPEREHRKAAMQVLSMAKNSNVKLCISSLTIANCAYILRKFCDRDSMRTILQKVCEICMVLPVNNSKHFRAFSTMPAYTASEFIEGCRRQDRESRL